MSPKNPRLQAGLTALGLFALAPCVGVAADIPPAPSAPVARAASAPVPSVLLLKNGNLHQGIVSEGGQAYYVHTRGGKFPVPKRDVEFAARSVREIYEYRVGQLPERDPDEHMKLARWCLTYRLVDEAKEQLGKVLALSPQNYLAEAMLKKIGGEEERVAQRDPAVAQASVEMASGRPEALDPAILGRAQRDLGVSTLPQIAGLPPALAVKRWNEYSRYIDPILQLRCAKCHNEQFAGSFQLIHYRRKTDRTVDALRTNFDAVLKLVDFDNVEKSELLSSTLRPHGKGANARPVFTGSNSPEYRVLAGWVNNLRTAPAVAAGAGAASRPGLAAATPEGEGFGAQRGTSAIMPPPLSPTPPSSTMDTRPQLNVGADTVTPRPPGQYLPGSGVGTDGAYAPPGTEFPAPYLQGGPKPTMPAAAGSNTPPPSLPPPVPGVPPGGGVSPAAGVPPSTGISPGVATDHLPALPGQPHPPAPTAGTAAAPKAKSSKPLKIDPELLQKALMNRNGARPQPPQ